MFDFSFSLIFAKFGDNTIFAAIAHKSVFFQFPQILPLLTVPFLRIPFSRKWYTLSRKYKTLHFLWKWKFSRNLQKNNNPVVTCTGREPGGFTDEPYYDCWTLFWKKCAPFNPVVTCAQFNPVVTCAQFNPVVTCAGREPGGCVPGGGGTPPAGTQGRTWISQPVSHDTSTMSSLFKARERWKR